MHNLIIGFASKVPLILARCHLSSRYVICTTEATSKALLHYAFLACVLEENARDFALGNFQYFLSDMMMEY